MEDVVMLFRNELFKAFYEWLEKNREALGEKWYSQLFNEAKDAENTASDAIGVIAVSMWMFSMITNFGIFAGIGPDGPKIEEINPELDDKSTKRLLLLISAAMNLQYLPRDMAEKPIPVISSKKFSLKLFVRRKVSL